MKNVVIILGAGASADAGAPLMKDFLDVAERLYVTGKVKEYEEDFKLLFQGYDALTRIYAKASIPIDNIESLFTAFEMAHLLGRLEPLSAPSIKRLPRIIKKVIEQTLLHTVILKKVPKPDGPGYITSPHESYKPFKRIFECIAEHSDKLKLSVITFNYDLCFDYTCH